MLVCNFAQAISGSGIWRKCVSKPFSDKLIIVLPDGCTAFSYYGLLYADEYARETNKQKIIVICDNSTVQNASKILIKSKLESCLLTKKEMSKLWSYLALCINLSYSRIIYSNLAIISEYYPDMGAYSYLNKGKYFEVSYIVWNRLYHYNTTYLAAEPKAKPPVGDFGDDELNAFMKFGTGETK